MTENTRALARVLARWAAWLDPEVEAARRRALVECVSTDFSITRWAPIRTISVAEAEREWPIPAPKPARKRRKS